MTRAQLEHLIRAAADIADDDELVIIGSQAVLGQYPDAPVELLASMEADVYPRNRPERADLIDGINRTWLQGDPAELVDFFHPDVVIQPPGDTPRVYGIGPCIESYAAFVRDARVRQFTPGDAEIAVFGGDEVADVTGAGDTVLAVLTVALAAGAAPRLEYRQVDARSSPGSRPGAQGRRG